MGERRTAQQHAPLRRSALPATPLALYQDWLAAARDAELVEPTAAALATAGIAGQPSCRMVLVRGADECGFVFYTNLDSRKGQQLRANPRAALTLHWAELGRQVRVEGAVAPVSAAESDAYFAQRSRDSRVSAAASPQSRPLRDRDELEQRIAALECEWRGRDLPRPAFWGGFRLRPERVEFWQNAVHRRHDRFVFEATEDGGWRVQRLAP